MNRGPHDRRVAVIYFGVLVAIALAVGAACRVPSAARTAWFRELGVSGRGLQEQVALIAALGCIALLAWAIARSPSPSSFARFAPWLLVVAIACAVVGAAQHLDRAYYFDVGDNGNYYLGAKYARELSYDQHYACFGVALESQGHKVPRRYRDLTNNKVGKLRPALDKGARERCMQAFSDERWKAFQHDVRRYRGWQKFPTLERRFNDHGYNGTPIWTTLAGSIANLVPINEPNQTWLALLNILLLAGTFALVIRAFGWELGLFYALVFWIQYADRFVLAGAFLRYLPLSLLSSGAALYKLERPAWAGACIGMAAGLLVFPGLFLAAGTAYLAWRLVSARSATPARAFMLEDKRVLRFLIAAGCVLVASFALSVLYTGGLESWQAFVEKMRLNSGRLATGRIGFIFNFLWPKAIMTDPNSYDAALKLLHDPGWLGLSLNHLRLALGAALIGGLAYAHRNASALTFMLIVGFALFFVGFPTVRYYYMGFVALPLALHAAPASRTSRASLALLFTLSAMCYVLDDRLSHAFLHNTLLTMGITVLLVALAVPKVAAQLAVAGEQTATLHEKEIREPVDLGEPRLT